MCIFNTNLTVSHYAAFLFIYLFYHYGNTFENTVFKSKEGKGEEKKQTK